MRPLSLLLVDDDLLSLDFIFSLAKEAFPNAAIAAIQNSTAVESLCVSQRFDCVILDYCMPVLDGLNCAKIIRQSFPHLPIVLATAGGDEELATSALQNGVTDYIAKSRLNDTSLRCTVERAIKIAAQQQTIDEQRTELETFAYALAHDFKQPLRQITTFTQMISDELVGYDASEIADQLAFLNKAAQRLANLVDVMSQYTLLGQSVVLEEVDLALLVSDVCASIAPYTRERNGTIVVESSEVFYGNETLMGQVLQNLIVNGLKYNSSNEPLVSISATRAPEFYQISVRDNGIGIEGIYQQDIFAPLIRLHSEAEYPGTGLGLSLDRMTLAAQGGTINCISEPGRGSEFIVKLPTSPRDESRSFAAISMDHTSKALTADGA